MDDTDLVNITIVSLKDIKIYQHKYPSNKDIYCYDNNNGNSSLFAMGSTETLNADRRKRVPRNWRMPFTKGQNDKQ
jgi:hypothetical protein